MTYLKTTPKGSLNVLITDGHSRSALAVARSLQRRSIPFLVLAENPRCLAYHSRCVNHLYLSPNPKKEPEAYIECALKAIHDHGIQLAIPISDTTLFLFNKHRNDLEKITKVAMPDSRAVRSVLDKRTNLRIAKLLGIPCPRQFELKRPHQIPEMIENLGFPIVIKNPGQTSDQEMSSFKFRVLYAHDEEELRTFIAKHCSTGNYPLFQEHVVGDVHNLCCFALEGKIIALHEYQSLRRSGGEGVLRRIIETTPELSAYARALLDKLNWDGVAHVGFFVEKTRQKIWYMETNGRFWASTEGSIQAGWDFPCWVYDYFCLGRSPEFGEIQIGSQTCWHLGDLWALLNYLKGGEPPTTGDPPGKARAILNYIHGFLPPIRADVFRCTDPLPFMMEHWKLIKRLGKKIKKLKFVPKSDSS